MSTSSVMPYCIHKSYSHKPACLPPVTVNDCRLKLEKLRLLRLYWRIREVILEPFFMGIFNRQKCLLLLLPAQITYQAGPIHSMYLYYVYHFHYFIIILLLHIATLFELLKLAMFPDQFDKLVEK